MRSCNSINHRRFFEQEPVGVSMVQFVRKGFNTSCPKVSIITPVLNGADTIVDALDSVASQDYPNIEHIIVDGNSRDESVSIAERYTHVNQIMIGEDSGIYDAINRGIKEANGEIIAVLNSDDFYQHPSVVGKMVQSLVSSNALTAYANLLMVDVKNTNRIVRKWSSSAFNTHSFYRGWMMPHPTLFVKREVYETYGYYNSKLQISADYEMMLRLFVKHNVSAVYVDDFIVKMRAGGRSNGSLRKHIYANLEDRKAWDAIGEKPVFGTLLLKPLRKVLQYR